MLLTKIREYMGVGLALVSAMTGAYSVIVTLNNKELHSRLELEQGRSEQLLSINQGNAKSIEDLLKQRLIDDKLITMLQTEYDSLASESRLARKKLENLKNEDSEFNRLLKLRHPVDVTRLLNSRVRNTGGGSQGDTAD